MTLIKRTEAVSRINELMKKAYVGGQPPEVIKAYERCRNAIMSCRLCELQEAPKVRIVVQDTLNE